MSSTSKKLGLAPKILIGLGVAFSLLVIGTIVLGVVSLRRDNKAQAELEAKARTRALERKAAEKAAFIAMSPEQHIAEAKKSLDANQIGVAKQHLNASPEGTRGKSEVLQRIASIEAKAKAERIAKAKETEIKLRQKMFEARKEFANKLEYNYLDKGLNIDVTAEGKDADVLKIKWVLTSKVAAHEISKGDLLDSARVLGFRKVRLTNDFDSSLAESYTWDLTK